MKELNKYDIDIINLSLSKHEYRFDISNSFFKIFESPLVEQGSLVASISLEKSETMIQCKFKIKGTIELTCDRSLEIFDLSVSIDEKIIYKFGDENKELTEEIFVIKRDSEKINVAQPVYDFISLAIPMKKIHPKYENQTAGNEENEDGVLIYTSTTAEFGSEVDEEIIDPRWSVLQKLKGQE